MTYSCQTSLHMIVFFSESCILFPCTLLVCLSFWVDADYVYLHNKIKSLDTGGVVEVFIVLKECPGMKWIIA